jgi:hypothetical protein
MPVYVDLRYGQLAHDLSTTSISITGPVLGPFLGVRLYRDEIRVATPVHEFALQRIGDWIYYDGTLYADAEVIAEEGIGHRRARRVVVFDPALAELACQDLG